jgi:hypothetical protein
MAELAYDDDGEWKKQSWSSIITTEQGRRRLERPARLECRINCRYIASGFEAKE